MRKSNLKFGDTVKVASDYVVTYDENFWLQGNVNILKGSSVDILCQAFVKLPGMGNGAQIYMVKNETSYVDLGGVKVYGVTFMGDTYLEI